MSYFHQAVNQLIHQIHQASPQVSRCRQTLDFPPHFALPDWLAAQTLFPKFYWQDRDGREEVVALGACVTFSDPAPAYQVITDSQRIWGGRSFDGGTTKNPHCKEAFFFLPQIELIREGHSWFLCANLTQARNTTVQALRQLQYEIPTLPPIATEVLSVDHAPQHSQWCQLVEQALSAMTQQQFDKVVLARQSTFQLTQSIQAAQLLKESRRHNDQSFHFLLAIDQRHSFVGSTPERLYQRHGEALFTEALAGTIGRSDNIQQDQALSDWLIHDEKNMTENQYVVDDIVDRLTPLARSVEVGAETALVKLRRVQHLKRHITAELNPSINGVQLLGALQPTAAVAGLPRQAAKTFIERYEPFCRGWYAGSIGYISHQRAEFCVAIRSALVMDKQVKLFAGAGIVSGSVAEHEWLELDRKMSTLLSLITEISPEEVVS
ncbi:isochorismate synthase MenF [Vibrio gazogenes]|uniref:Isochorismate synthase MenF n=1 Tax=Vibrio gazogenes DSM 21264 = NBRC 103151 TaxID=1123492 RepID=A0A1M5FYF0_VIBGA|nr:isochorismate synthase [Vibrio gazogenes]USP14700.1 isochorismate synthase [Vibrio gazogenes]SHF96518.1 isochorismate synthase [Vibrio gazogenes DSM 21264] [Vibrio gazogenes DSM 21264 = NBRC 103151]SJN52927.1 Menaquinone-specific isochorismate synthase [Vibrio gazogenes]